MNTLQDKFLAHMKKYGQGIKVNESNNTAFFKEIDDKNSEDMKYMYIALGACKQGDYVGFDDYNWLVISQGESYNGVYEKAVIKKCQYDIRFIIDGILEEFPSAFETKTIDIDTNQYISLPDNTIKVTMQLNDSTKAIGVNTRFINTSRVWKIIGIDRTKDNLISFTCNLDGISADDDLINEIPNKSSYTITITNTNFTIGETMSTQVNAVFKKGDTIIDGATFKYSIDNTNFATISSTGLLTGINGGTVNITVSVKENPYYSVTKEFIIEALSTAQTYNIVPASEEIFQGDTINYTCNKYINEVLTPTTWSIQNLTGSAVPSSGYYTFSVTGTNTFSISNIKTYSAGKVKVRCTDVENLDSEYNYIEIPIILKGLW